MSSNFPNVNRFVYLIIFSVFFIPYFTSDLSTMKVLPRQAILFVELLFVISAGIIALHAALRKSFGVAPKYIMLFFALILHLLVGIILNEVQPGTILSGIRSYLKFTPLFLLPAVFKLDTQQLHRYLKLLLMLAFIQLPLVIYQKISNPWAADSIAGTFVVGSIMSIYLLSAISVSIGLYYRKSISMAQLIAIISFAFIPTLLNETKSVFIFLPVILIFATIASGNWKEKKIHLFGAIGGGLLLLGAFTLVYNLLFNVAGKEGLINFFVNPQQGAITYLFTGDAEVIDPEHVLDVTPSLPGANLPFSLEDQRAGIRRGDSIILAFRVLSKDPIKLFFGLGIGNASVSIIPQYSGRYSFLGELSTPLLTALLWETGVFGALLLVIFFLFIFQDAYSLARQPGITGGLAIGWTGIVIIMILSLPYKNILVFYPIGALFWYLSGYIASKRFEIDRELKNIPVKKRTII